MAAAAMSKTAPPPTPSASELATSSFHTAVRVASMPSPLDQATAIAHARATLSACNVAATALRAALAEVESKIDETNRRAVDTSRVAAAAAEYARASAERVSAQSVAETLCPDAIAIARLGSPSESTAARSLAARVELLRGMAASVYELRPEQRLAAAEKAHRLASDAVKSHQLESAVSVPKPSAPLSEEALDLWRCAVYVRVAEVKGDSCPPCAKARAVAAQETLDSVPDADAKEAFTRAGNCITDGTPSPALAKAARAMLVQSGTVYAESCRLQQAVTDAKIELDAATEAVAKNATFRDEAEANLAAAQSELDAIVESTSLDSASVYDAASTASASASTDEDPESVAGTASSARARFNAAVQAESAALAELNHAQSGIGSSGATLASLRTAHSDILDKLAEIEQLIQSSRATSK